MSSIMKYECSRYYLPLYLDERGEYRRKRLYSKMNTLITKY